MVSVLQHISCIYIPIGCMYSDMGTEYGHPRYLLNQNIK